MTPHSASTPRFSPDGLFGPPAVRFVAGLLAVPPFLFQENRIVQAAQVLVFVVLSVLSGKKFRLLPNLMIGAGIIVMNLLTPQGSVLFSVGSFYMTAGALDRGIAKTLVLIGLIYLSRFSVTKGLSLPGRIGGLLSRVFYYFEEITKSRGGFTRGNMMARLDEILISVQEQAAADRVSGGETGEPAGSETDTGGAGGSVKEDTGAPAAGFRPESSGGPGTAGWREFIFPILFAGLNWAALFIR